MPNYNHKGLSGRLKKGTISIQKTGDWRGIKKKLHDTKDKGPVEFSKDIDRLALLIEQKLKEAIITQGASINQKWAPLAPRTLANKAGEAILIDSYEYLTSISVQVDKKRKRGFPAPGKRGYVLEWEVAPLDLNHKGGKGKRRTINMQTLAGYLEYGTTRMPARPHWGPVALWARQEASRLVRTNQTKRIRWLNNIWRKG